MIESPSMSEKSAIRTVYFPASFAQERLWLLDQLQPGDPTYNMGAAIRFTGTLNVPALQGSLNQLIRRHEILRTVFEVRDGALKQAILPVLELDIHSKLVQYIKLAEVQTGIGSEYVRAPRLPLEGKERERILKVIGESVATRPALPDYLSILPEKTFA